MPGEEILADRGFLIRDSPKTLRGYLEIPAFTKGKIQLDPAEIESSRKVASKCTKRSHFYQHDVLKKQFYNSVSNHGLVYKNLPYWIVFQYTVLI